MDLLNTIGAIRKVLGLFADTPDSDEPWAVDEESFEVHFGRSYEYFIEILHHLDEEQTERFDDTMKVNPEAAVLWILSMEPE